MPKFSKPNYTQLPNEIVDRMMPDLSGAQFKVLILIARKTLGFHRECHAMSLEFIAEGTGLSRQGVVDALKPLVDDGYIIKEFQFVGPESTRPASSLYSLNVDSEDNSEPSKNLTVNLDLSTVKFFDGKTDLTVQKLDGSEGRAMGKVVSFKESNLKESNPIVPFSTQPTQEEKNESPTLDPEEVAPPTKTKSKFKNRWGKPVDPERENRKLIRQSQREALTEMARSEASRPATASERTSPSQTSPQVPAIDYVALWTQLVPSAPAVWSERYNGRLLREALTDSTFVENFEDLARKAELINTHSEIGPWLTLQAFLSVAKGSHAPHWHRILTGQYTSMMTAKKTGKGTPPPEDYFEKHAAEMLKKARGEA